MTDERDVVGGGAPPADRGQDEPVRAVHEAVHLLEQRLRPLLLAAERAAAAGSGIGQGAQRSAARALPAWRRATAGELRWPVSLVVLGMICLQLALPAGLTLTGRWLLPGLEAVLGVLLAVSNPRRLTRRSLTLRTLSLLLIGTASLANGWSAVRLVADITGGHTGTDAVALLVTGGNVWLTNIIVSGLWYWELDRGGPAARAMALDLKPDFLFPEMTAPELAGHEWEPTLPDYLYVAFTNATAFSPTDTLPFSRWAKLAMMMQSTVSLATGLLVIARAVNILPA